jgi:PST family polysaccharide transporter
MDFRRIAIIKIASITVGGVVAVVMALSGFGVWSLVANSLLMTTASVVIMWRLSSWKPKWIWDLSSIRELFGYSINLFGFRTLNYWISNIDNLLIGKYVSAAALGVYGRAYSLMRLPSTQISSVLSRVMFPVLSSIQTDKKKVKQIYLKANRSIALVTFPMMIGLLVVARPFILTIYGNKWEAVILILQIFCLDGMMRSISTTVGWIYLSQGRTDIMFKWGLFAGVVMVISIVIGLYWGAVGVAVAIVVSGYAILWYPEWTIAGRLIDLTFGEMLKNLSGPFLCSSIMASAVATVGLLLPAMWPHWARLATQVPFGIAVYVLLVHFFKIKACLEVRELAIEQWRGRLRSPDKTEPPPE